MHKYTVAAHTDVGVVKKINQDSLLIEIAETDIGQILLAAVCDGMGGLSQGEIASATMTRAIGEWFENSLAASICKSGSMISFDTFRTQCDFMIRQTGKKIAKEAVAESGTTICALLCAGGTYYTANVGDSRIYKTQNNQLLQITKDQTVVQMQYEAGKITKEEMETHPQRSVLLQCVGATDHIIPVYGHGTYTDGDRFLLCSDGFRHKVNITELQEVCCREQTMTKQQMEKELIRLTSLLKTRKERDNISSLLIQVEKQSRFS